jgi:hypothetical protein
MNKKKTWAIYLVAIVAISFLSFKAGEFKQELLTISEKDRTYPRDLIQEWRKSKRLFGCYDVNKEMQIGFSKIKINDTLYAAVSYSNDESKFRIALISPSFRIAQDDWDDSCLLRPDQLLPKNN